MTEPVQIKNVVIVMTKDKSRNTHPHTQSYEEKCDDDIKVVPNNSYRIH